MARGNKLIRHFQYITTLLVGVTVGGLFLDGTSLSNVLIGWIPQVVHIIVGWAIMIGSVVDYINKVRK